MIGLPQEQWLEGDAREQRLVGEKLVGQTVDLDGVRVVAALRIQVEVQRLAGHAAVPIAMRARRGMGCGRME